MLSQKLRSRCGGLAVCLALGAGLAGPARAQEPARPKSEGPPRPALYDTKADALAQVAAASLRARRDQTRLLVMFGFNTCGWCRKLHTLFETDAGIRKLLHDEYDLVMVDIEAPHAAQLLQKCKSALGSDELAKGVGYPFLAVLDPDGNVVKAQRTDPLEEGDHHDPGRVKAFLERWVAERVDAEKVLAEAKSRASSAQKRIFLHFGAPWCGWCHRLDDFLAQEEIAAILSRDYIEVKIDIDRMTHGKEMLSQMRGGESGGIPWIALLDADGKRIVTSDAPKGNIGYPAAPQEIDHFLAMLRKSSRHIDPAQLDRIEAVLRAEGEKIQAARRRS